MRNTAHARWNAVRSAAEDVDGSRGRRGRTKGSRRGAVGGARGARGLSGMICAQVQQMFAEDAAKRPGSESESGSEI